MKRLYVVVRADLPPGLQMAQACHATRAFGLQNPGADVGDNLVVLQVPGEAELRGLFQATLDYDMACFSEPDLGGQLTAIAVEGSAGPLLSTLPLALRAD